MGIYPVEDKWSYGTVGIDENQPLPITDQQYIDAVATSDELEVNDHNVTISRGDDGAFVQTWTWVPNSAIKG